MKYLVGILIFSYACLVIGFVLGVYTEPNDLKVTCFTDKNELISMKRNVPRTITFINIESGKFKGVKGYCKVEHE